MKKIQKRLLSWLMVMAMVLSVIHISAPMVVQAEDGVHGITLGIPSWTDARTKYTFPDVTVDMDDGADKQKIFCISVSDDGYFEADLSSIYDTMDISAVRYVNHDGKYADNSSVYNSTTTVDQLSKTEPEKLISITILGNITDEQIKSFISSLIFYRNVDDVTLPQEVSVVSSPYDVRNNGGTALAIDGKLHIYKYIDWDSDQTQTYVGGESAIISKSAVAGDISKWTWFDAYRLSKSEKLNGLKGYLATITSIEEQAFIFNKFGAIRTTNNAENGAWIGGARTFADLSTDSTERSANANGIIFDSDTMNKLIPADSDDGLTGAQAQGWRWMCGPESQTEATRHFYQGATATGSMVTYSKWTTIGTPEPNNFNSNRYGQEFCLQYGFEGGGEWNDWGPDHSPKSNDESLTPITGEIGNFRAPAGFIVEFSPYDINKDGKEDEGEAETVKSEEDLTIITAQPHVVIAELDKTTFKFNEPITVTSLLGDNTVKDGVPSDQLIDKIFPKYQWEYFDEESNTWKNATGEGNDSKSYTPIVDDVGRRLRVHITALDNDTTNNPDHYVGDIYLDATGSDDQSNKIKGTPVEYDKATVTGNDFMVDKDDLPGITKENVLSDYSKAEAKVDESPVAVKPITDSEMTALKNTMSGNSTDITLVNGIYNGVKTTVKATVFDNATKPQTDKNNKISQIGSNDFSVARGSSPLTKEDVIKYGNVTVLTDGENVTGNYTITDEDLKKLNDAIKNGPDNTVVPVKVKDDTTGLETTVNVTVKPIAGMELESAKLAPFKGKDENGDWTHYYAGDTITLSEIKLSGIDVPLTGAKLTDGTFIYKWQNRAGNEDPKAWNAISEADDITLSADNTTKYAKNKIQLVITPKNESGINTTNVKGLYVDGDGFSKENGNGSDNTTGGTFIDVLTIDANDFVVSLEEAKAINDAKAAEVAGVETAVSNNNTDKSVNTTPTSNVTTPTGLKNVTEPGEVPVEFKATTTVDSNTIDARDIEDYSKIGKTVTAFVKDSAKTETLEGGTKIGIGANNVELTIGEAKALLEANTNPDQAKTLSGKAKVVVVDGSKSTQADALTYNNGNGSVVLTYAVENPFKAEVGTYPVTYTYTNAEGKTVSTVANVTVVSKADIKATDFIISVDDAKTVPEDEVEKKANATGKDDDGKPVDNSKLDVDDDDINDIHNVTKPGDVPVVIKNTSTDPNKTTKVTAHVVDKTENDPIKNITIGANNFEIYPEQVKKALAGDTDILKQLSGVIAMDNGVDVPSASIQVTDAYKTDLKPVPGTYDVTFTYNGVSVTVKATVKVPSIDAHDFIISVDDAKKATEDDIKGKSDVIGADKNAVPVGNDKLDVDDDAMKAIKAAGENKTTTDVDVKLVNTSDEPYPEITVTGHVVDATDDNKDTESDPDKQITIGANNFFISPEDAKKAIEGNDDILKTLSEVLAIEGYKDVPFADIKVTDKTNLKTEEGSYPVKFGYKDVEVKVLATVKAPKTATIDGHDIIISVDKTKDVTPELIKDLSDADGKDPFEKSITPSDIAIKDEDVDKIKNTDVPDMIPVEIKNTTGDPNPTKTINAFIVDEQKDNKDTQTDPTKQISIGANNFDISVEDAQKAIDGDDAILRQLSSVVAVAGGVNVKTSDIKVADKTQLKAEPGKYPVTFSYTKDGETVEVTVDATVKANSGSKDAENKGDNNKDNGDGEEITGNDFTVKGGSDPLTPDDIINKGNVDAVDGNGTPIVLPPDSSVKKEDLEKLNDAIKDGKKGTYPVLVSTPKGTQVTVNVTVTDENDNTKPDDTKTDETIAANDFKIGVNDFDKIFGDPTKKDDIVKKLSNAQAYDTDLKTPVEITGIDTTQVKKEPGTYPVTLTTAKGTTTTIKVTVDKDWDTIGDIDKASDSNKTGETIDNDTAKKIVPVAPPVKTGTDGTSELVKPEDITYEKTNPQDKTEPIDPSKQVPTTGALTINGVPVDSYTISPDGKSLIISKDYLNTLPKGSYPAVLTYADGTKQEFNVNVVDFDETTLVKNPPLFSMYKEIVLKKKNTFTVNLKGISDYAIVTSEITGKGKKAKKVVTIKQQKNGDVLITPKKVGKSQVTCKIVQNGAEYKVVVDLKVLKQYKGTSKNYNLKPKGLVKTSGELPEFNVYKRIVKGKNTKIKFTKVATDAKVKFYVANKKEAKSLKIGKIKRKGKTATCTIKGKKKGWVHLTAEITQNGKTYYTRLLVRIDDGTWSKKQLKKYLK